MSKSYLLPIEPKAYKPKDAEHHKFTGIDCPSCEGGIIKSFEDYLQIAPPETKMCDRCNGTGKLCADVVIRWQADDIIIE